MHACTHTHTHAHTRMHTQQEFDPQEFSSTLNESTQDADRGVVLNFMSSSHMPYILNRLQISLKADDEGTCVLTLPVVTWKLHVCRTCTYSYVIYM